MGFEVGVEGESEGRCVGVPRGIEKGDAKRVRRGCEGGCFPLRIFWRMRSKSSVQKPATVMKNGADMLRPCGDYRNINLKTVTDSSVIPNLHSFNLHRPCQMLLSCTCQHVFSKLELVKGYYQVPVNKAS